MNATVLLNRTLIPDSFIPSLHCLLSTFPGFVKGPHSAPHQLGLPKTGSPSSQLSVASRPAGAAGDFPPSPPLEESTRLPAPSRGLKTHFPNRALHGSKVVVDKPSGSSGVKGNLR